MAFQNYSECLSTFQKLKGGVMDINKENTKYLASLLANCGATQDEINDLSFDDEVGIFESNRLADWFVSQINFGWRVWQAAKAQAVPEGFVLVEKELSWVKADHLACAEWEKNKALFCTENRDITAQIEEYRLRWCKNKAHKIMSEYKAMIEAQEQSHECPNP